MAPKILLVDDNQELLALLARLVEAEGWVAVSAGRGKTALEAIAAERPAAAVVDVLLPDMMGYDVAHALKNALVPFVFMTGVFKGGRAANDARAQHGAAGYFEKPFEARKLIEAIRQLLPADTGEVPAPRPVAAPAPRPAPSPAEPSDFDVEVAVEADEPVEAMDLTGNVVLTEDGKVSAVLKGATVHVGAPGRRRRAPAPRPRAPRTRARGPRRRAWSRSGRAPRATQASSRTTSPTSSTPSTSPSRPAS